MNSRRQIYIGRWRLMLKSNEVENRFYPIIFINYDGLTYQCRTTATNSKDSHTPYVLFFLVLGNVPGLWWQTLSSHIWGWWPVDIWSWRLVRVKMFLRYNVSRHLREGQVKNFVQSLAPNWYLNITNRVTKSKIIIDRSKWNDALIIEICEIIKNDSGVPECNMNTRSMMWN